MILCSDIKAAADEQGLRIQRKTSKYVIGLLGLKQSIEHTNVTKIHSRSVDPQKNRCNYLITH